MFYYLMLTFFIFVGLFAHITIAVMADSILEDIDSTGWYKKHYSRYLLIPGMAEIVLGILILVCLGVVMYTFILTFFKD